MPRGTFFIAATPLAPHKLSPVVQLCLILVVSAAVQGNVVHGVNTRPFRTGSRVGIVQAALRVRTPTGKRRVVSSW